MYHQVADIPRNLDPRGLAIPPLQFEQQMSYLERNNYHCLSLQEAVEYYKNGKRPPVRSFVLTFDDGYHDFYVNAAPLMDKFRFNATIFLVVGRADASSDWWVQEGATSGQLLSWEEVRNLAQRGYIFGSHSLNHPFLDSLDVRSAYLEICNSKLLLEAKLNTRVDFFSYPYSVTNLHIEKMVEKAGYTAACAGDSGPLSVFHLWRVPCYRYDSSLSFALKTSGWYNIRTALRESLPGITLRRFVRVMRRKESIRR